MDRRFGPPTTWMWKCRNCEEQGFVDFPDSCPNCGAEGEGWCEWFPMEAR